MIIDTQEGKLRSGRSIESDLHISALGFETRCMSLLQFERVSSRKLLFLQFPNSAEFSYQENSEFAKSKPCADFIEYPSPSFLFELRKFLQDTSYRKISIDISSMNRTMVSAVLSCLAQNSSQPEISLHYVPAKFSAPGVGFSDLFSAGPVLPEFSAFEDASDLPSTVLMGLGYEYGVALGLINLIEPENAICMFAQGHDDRYEAAVRKANLQFKFPGTDATTIAYDLFDPASAYEFVSATIRNLLPTHRISLIPMGPKILSSLFVLASIEHLGDVTLWRVVRNSKPSNAVHDDVLVSFSIDTARLTRKSSRYQEVFEVA